MRTEDEIKRKIQDIVLDYTSVKASGDITNTKRIKLETAEKILKWVLQEDNQ